MVIFIIRHCDKPRDKKNPCCSHIGYKRAEYWREYFRDYKNMTTYTAGFSTTPNQCLKGFSYLSDKHCQHSQRMLLTSHIIGKPIQYQYCIGDEKRLVNDIMKKKEENSLIVWQHEGIPKILNYLNISNTIDSSLYNQVIKINDNKLLSNAGKEDNWINICAFFGIISLFGFFCLRKVFCSKRQDYIRI